ncbi:MAG: TonB family protein [Bacteroidaceae bacterium]|nr:TonB family protein [Bacteroidaceae bacterium]
MMTDVLMYSLKSAFVLFLLYVPYTLLLHRDSFFRLNRFVLLGVLLLSLVLPLCNVSWLSMDRQPVVHAAQMQMVEIGIPVNVLPQNDVVEEVAEVSASSSFTLFGLLTLIYIIGMAVVLLLRLWQMGSLRLQLRRGSLWRHSEDGITVYCHADRVAPFSWMNSIVISEEDYAESGREIILHETGHIRFHHSWDVLLLTLVQMVQWWNPLAYMAGISLRDVHEYEADDYVLRQGVSASAYQMLLLKKAVGYGSYTFANNFNHSLTKKRIAMMRKTKSNPWMRSKVLYVIPVTTLALSVFATPEIVSPVQDVVSKFESKGTDTSGDLQTNDPFSPEIMEGVQNAATANEDTIYGKVDKNAEYPGGTEALMKFMMTNLKYPETCRKEGIQGRVVIKFVVNTDGSIVDMEEARSPHADLTAEAMRVIKMMPKWTPATVGGKTVRSRFNLPVMFRLDGGKKTQYTSPQKPQSPQSLTDEQKAVHDWFGAQPELMTHLNKNIRYPKECQEQGFEGRVLVSIAVEKDGSVSVDGSEYKPVSSKNDTPVAVNAYKNADGTQKTKLSEEELKNLMIKEAERVLKLSPKLKPYKNGKGETVRATFKVPVMFRLH